jgi:hypothetical protein
MKIFASWLWYGRYDDSIEIDRYAHKDCCCFCGTNKEPTREERRHRQMVIDNNAAESVLFFAILALETWCAEVGHAVLLVRNFKGLISSTSEIVVARVPSLTHSSAKVGSETIVWLSCTTQDCSAGVYHFKTTPKKEKIVPSRRVLRDRRDHDKAVCVWLSDGRHKKCAETLSYYFKMGALKERRTY